MYSSFFHGVWGGVGWGGVRGDPQEGDIEKIKQKLGAGQDSQHSVYCRCLTQLSSPPECLPGQS